MESSKSQQIDTSSSYLQSQDLTTTDKLVLKVMSSTEDLDYHLSPYELIKYFKDYELSLKKFKIYPEEFFYQLQLKNKQLDEFQDVKIPQDPLEHEQEIYELIKNFNKTSINYIIKVPNEVLCMILQYLDIKSLVRSMGVCKDWKNLYQWKGISKVIKLNCFAIWKPQLYQATQQYLLRFENWRTMIKLRPLVRFDGFYICKIMYRRTGMSETSNTHPVHEVISYKYLRFFQDGTMNSLYTNSNPKKFLPKLKQHLQHQKEIQEKKLYDNSNKASISMQNGIYYIKNNVLTISQQNLASEFRYEFVMVRNSAQKTLNKEGDYLELKWAGFKVDQSDEHNFGEIKLQNYEPNKYMFKQVYDLPA